MKKIGSFFLSVAFFLGAVAIVEASTPPLKIRMNSDPTTLDWNRQLDLPSERLSYQLMEGLVRIDEHDKLQPALAESWKTSGDGKTLTFVLRKNIVWSDGRALRAQDFVDSWLRVLDPKTGAPGAEFLYEIVGAEDFNKSKPGAGADQIGIQAKDDRTLIIRLTTPSPYFTGVFDMPLAFPIRKDLIAQHGDRWLSPENLVTVGPYKLQSYRNGVSIDLVANPRYYGKKPRFENARFMIVGDDTTALQLYQQGQLDLLTGLPVMDLATLGREKSYRALTQRYMNYVAFDTSRGVFQDSRIRRAFALATDTEDLCRLLQGGKLAATGLIPSKLPAHLPKRSLKYDVAKAKQELKAAGYMDGKAFPEVTLLLSANDENRILAERLQEMWRKNLGISVKVGLESWKTFFGRINSDPPPMFKAGVAMVYPDPHSFALGFMSGNVRNRGRWKNAEYDSLVSKASSERSLKSREKIYKEAQQILLDREAVIIPLFESPIPAMLSERVSGLTTNGRGMFLLGRL